LCDSSQFIVAGCTVFFRTDSDSLVAIRGICEGASLAKARKKILCIEDDPNSAGLIAQELAGRGFEISLADNGSEGFVAILKDKPDRRGGRRHVHRPDHPAGRGARAAVAADGPQ
jgi:hypothetical protein